MTKRALFLMCIIVAGCKSSQPVASPTPVMGPREAKGTFCRDWTAFTADVAWPITDMSGTDDADAIDRMVAGLEPDARRISTDDPATAARIVVLTDALSALADEIRSSPASATGIAASPASTVSPGEAGTEADTRRAELYQAVIDAAAPLKPMCLWFAQNTRN